MEWVETTGKSVAEAKEAALDQLGVDEADAEFELVAEPKTGLFGRLKAEARVRARVRPTTPRSKEAVGRRKRRPERERSSSDRSDRAEKSERSEKPERPERTERADRPPRRQPSKANATTTAATDGDSSTFDSEADASDNQSRRRRSNRRRPKPESTEDEGAPTMDEQVALADQGAVAEQFVSGLLTQMNVQSQIEVAIDEEEENVSLAVTGEQLGHLIGPRGSTLHALQELARTVVQRKTGARSGRVLIDINQYREKRREALARFAYSVADEVKSSGSQRILEPMNPADRKVVHDAINEVEGVVTTSEGEEPRRRVVIKPAGSA